MRAIAGAAAAVILLAVGGVAWAAIPNADGTIYACYNNGDGSVRVHDDPARTCPRNWSPLRWAAGQPDVPVTTTYWERTSADVDPGDFLELNVSCHPGDVATGGGYSVGSNVVPEFSHPNPAAGPDAVDHVPTGWRVVAHNVGTGARIATAYVVCQHTA